MRIDGACMLSATVGVKNNLSCTPILFRILTVRLKLDLGLPLSAPCPGCPLDITSTSLLDTSLSSVKSLTARHSKKWCASLNLANAGASRRLDHRQQRRLDRRFHSRALLLSLA